MADLAHVWGSDLLLSSTGGLQVADTPDLTTQRVLRRLMTCPGDYIFHPEYGAGLPAYVGETVHAQTLTGVVLEQLRLEAEVGLLPVPAVDVQQDVLGTVLMAVRYADRQGQQQTLAFGINGGA